MIYRLAAPAVLIVTFILAGAQPAGAAKPLSGSYIPTDPPRVIPDFIVKNDKGQSYTLHEILKQ